MIVAFSTSSPLVGVGLFEPGGPLIAMLEKLAPRAASGACLLQLQILLEETRLNLKSASLFVADLGPGSFTGVKVGVTLAKTFALALGTQTSGVTSFDLLDPNRPSVVSSKRGEWLVREPGKEPRRSSERPASPFVGYGEGITEPVYPSVSRLPELVARLELLAPESLLPAYLTEPSISMPRKPFAS